MLGRTHSGDQWWDELRGTGAGNPIPDGQQIRDTPTRWKQWGGSESQVVSFQNAGDVLVQFKQVVSAEFYHPLAWMLAFNLTQQTSSAVPDLAVFRARITYGLGRARFQHLFAAGTLSPLNAGPFVSTFGPVPAESIIIDGEALISPAGAVFPKQSVFSFGAFVAPQVWA